MCVLSGPELFLTHTCKTIKEIKIRSTEAGEVAPGDVMPSSGPSSSRLARGAQTSMQAKHPYV